MWDIGGQEKIRKDWYTYYTHTEFVIIVVDSTDRERLPVTKEELSNMIRHEELKKAAVLIFANKQVSEMVLGALLSLPIAAEKMTLTLGVNYHLIE